MKPILNMNNKKFNDMSEIIWDVKEDSSGKTYFSDRRCEFIISKEDDFWVLRYTDFTTVSPSYFFVNIKKSGEEMLVIPELKMYAQKVFDQYREIIHIDL